MLFDQLCDFFDQLWLQVIRSVVSFFDQLWLHVIRSVVCLFSISCGCMLFDQLCVFFSISCGCMLLNQLCLFSISCGYMLFDQLCFFSISRGYMLFDQLCDFFRSVAVAFYSISCMSISYSMSDLKRVIVVAIHFTQRLRTDRGVNLGISIMNLPSEWTLFLNLVDDLLNECESRM